MPKYDLSILPSKLLIFRWLLASSAAIASWFIISPSLDRRSGVGLDLSQLSPAVIMSLEDVTHRFDFADRENSVYQCPGVSCPLNVGASSNVLRYERKVSGNLATMITTEGWNRTLYMAWDVKVPRFVAHRGDEIALDFYGIRGRSWRFFVNGQEQGSGKGATELPPIMFKSPGLADEPMTIGFEVDVGNSLAPGIVHIGQVFLSQPESASKFRLAYRGLDRAAVLPTATGFALLGLLAALACFFTPFFRETLAFSICVNIFNLRLLSVNNFVPFQSLPGVDFVTVDVIMRSSFFAAMWAFWCLYFRVKTNLKLIPVVVYLSFAGFSYAAGLTGVGLEILVVYVRTIELQQALVFFGAALLAYNTWTATRKLSLAKFRSYTATLIFISAVALGLSFVLRSVITANGMNWELYRRYELLFFVTNHAMRLFILAQGVLLVLEWALVVRDRQKFEKELELGRLVQDLFMKSPRLPSDIDFSCHFDPAFYVSGDAYFVHWDDSTGRFIVIIGDMTGHGVHAALKASTLHVMAQTIFSDAMHRSVDLGARFVFYEQALDRFLREFWVDGDLPTFVGIELDLSTGRVVSHRSNFPFPMIVEQCEDKGWQVKVWCDQTTIVDTRKSDRSIFFISATDGVISSSKIANKVARDLEKRLAGVKSVNAELIKQQILESTKHVQVGMEDDRTMVVFGVKRCRDAA